MDNKSRATSYVSRIRIGLCPARTKAESAALIFLTKLVMPGLLRNFCGVLQTYNICLKIGAADPALPTHVIVCITPKHGKADPA